MRRTATAAIILTTGLLFSACSSDEDTEATDPDTTSSASSAATPSEDDTTEESGDTEAGSGDVAPEDIPSLALTAADFPAPFAYTEIPEGALEAGGEALGGALAGAEYTPAECGNASQAAEGADLSQAGVALAVDQAAGTTLTSILSPEIEQDVDLEEVAEACATFTFSLGGPDGTGLEGDATLEVLPEPDVDADDARAIKTTVSVSLGGQAQTVDNYLYAAELRGVSVLTSASVVSGADFDTAVLDDLLAAGVDKVRSAP